MKRSLFIIVVFLIIGTAVNAQGILKKAGKAMQDELLGTKPKKTEQPEPPSACDKPSMVMDMGGKLQLDYKELTISISKDGRILAKDLHADNYYIVENGATVGPFKPGDKRLKGFEINMSQDDDTDSDSETKKNPWEGNPYITKSGDKFLISFGGKSYGPYGSINNFTVTKSKDKFAAIVVENVIVTTDQGKAMEEAMKNAKTQQEQMDLSMKYAAEMQQKMMQGGGPNSMMAKLVTNTEGISGDWTKNLGGSLNGTMKYDDILMTLGSDIKDLKGNKILTVTSDQAGADFFINADNSRYAWYEYGTLNFSDKTTLAELFNPQLVKAEGKIFLSYMYYSPKKNSILQCKIPF
jgi:hypothetical protein